MMQEKVAELTTYLNGGATPCDRDGKQAVCRSVTAGPYMLEEVIFTEGDRTRFELSESLNFYCGGTRTANIEQGEVVAVTGCTGYTDGRDTNNGSASPQLLEPITPLRERHAVFMIRGFAREVALGKTKRR